MVNNLLETIRRQLFWTKDKLSGSLVKKELQEITKSLETPHNEQTMKLQKLLDSVSSHCSFYSDLEGKKLQDFPVINKNLIRNNWNQFLSTAYSEGNLIATVTSGSTGTPFKVLHSKSKKIRNTADTIYFSDKCGYEIGNRLFYLKIWAKEKMASGYNYWLQNMVPQDVIKLGNNEISQLLSQIKNYNGKVSLLGYVSAFTEVCKYLERTDQKAGVYKVQSIITMSEALDNYTAEKMQLYFSAPVYSRYSNLENGIIAQQMPGSGKRFLINGASYLVEVLKMHSDEPASNGTLGRIVVTDLYNDAFPMIRYDTGDLGILGEADKNGNLYLDKIEGRKLDMLFDTEGNVVSSYIMYKNMFKYLEIDQYQLIQEKPKKYTFKISMRKDHSFTKENQLISEFKSILGSDADFSVEYVEEIPLLNSGKRRKMVNLMLKS